MEIRVHYSLFIVMFLLVYHIDAGQVLLLDKCTREGNLTVDAMSEEGYGSQPLQHVSNPEQVCSL
jgi:hypothetical protein